MGRPSLAVREVCGAQAQQQEGPIGLADFPKAVGHGTFGLGWLLTSQKKCVAPRAVSSRQNLSVGFGVQVPDAFNNAKVAVKIQQMSRGCCPEKKSSRQLQAPAAMATTRTAEATRRPLILANLSRIVQL